MSDEQLRFADVPSRAEVRDNIEEDYWSEWTSSIDLKLSRQGQMILGLGGVVLITLALTGLQGKVVVKLVKGYGEIVDILNKSSLNPNATGGSEPSGGRYSKPSGNIDESKVGPVDEEELADLHEKIRATSDTPKDEGLL